MKERQYARTFRKLSSAILQAILSLVLSSYRSVIAGSFHVFLFVPFRFFLLFSCVYFLLACLVTKRNHLPVDKVRRREAVREN